MTLSNKFIILTILSTLLAGSLFFIPKTTNAQSVISEPVAQIIFVEPVVVEKEKTGIFYFIGSNFIKGVKAVSDTVKEWILAIARPFGLTEDVLVEGEACTSNDQCRKDLICVNSCKDGDGCEVYGKSCEKIKRGFTARTELEIKSEFLECGEEDLCTKGTFCTNTCPEGVSCPDGFRCLKLVEGEGSCSFDSECISLCENKAFAPIGSSSIRPVCQENSCFCKSEAVNPDLNIIRCTPEALSVPIICPIGTRASCTTDNCSEEICNPRITCLTAPEYGGQCLNNDACSAVVCTSGTNPFCGADYRCRCRGTEEITFSCVQDSQCTGISCAADEVKACVNGTCSCGKTELAEEDLSCEAPEDCVGECGEGFEKSCVDNLCGCQRTFENVPVACTTVDECTLVNCPEGFDKICHENQCACTKTTFE